jgi:hypothetical protein
LILRLATVAYPCLVGSLLLARQRDLGRTLPAATGP